MFNPLFLYHNGIAIGVGTGVGVRISFRVFLVNTIALYGKKSSFINVVYYFVSSRSQINLMMRILGPIKGPL